MAPYAFHITDSYKIKTPLEMALRLELAPILDFRSLRSCIREWRAHNLLYDLHIQRARTRSVDLDYPQTFIYKAGYFVLSLFYFKGGFYL